MVSGWASRKTYCFDFPALDANMSQAICLKWASSRFIEPVWHKTFHSSYLPCCVMKIPYQNAYYILLQGVFCTATVRIQHRAKSTNCICFFDTRLPFSFRSCRMQRVTNALHFKIKWRKIAFHASAAAIASLFVYGGGSAGNVFKFPMTACRMVIRK
jgi:hypothetical protein